MKVKTAMSEVKNTVYKKLTYPGENKLDNSIIQALKLCDHFSREGYDHDDGPTYKIIMLITFGLTRPEVMNRMLDIANNEFESDLTPETIRSKTDIVVCPIKNNTLDLDYAIDTVKGTIEEAGITRVKVSGIVIYNLQNIKGLNIPDALFIDKIAAIDNYLKEYASTHKMPIIYTKQMPSTSTIII